MKRWKALCAGVATLAVFAGTAAIAQQPPPAASTDCKTKSPAKVDGQVVSVDQNAGKVTIKDKSGTTHEFQTSRETAQTMKAGDKIEATLREAPKC
jgi:Cu/Ag efflux protein CusF